MGHTVPQLPQFMASDIVLTHAMLQDVSGAMQAHMPLVQVCELPHLLPQAPQLLRSVFVSAQTVTAAIVLVACMKQLFCPLLQVIMPVPAVPPVAAVLPAVPPPPDFPAIELAPPLVPWVPAVSSFGGSSFAPQLTTAKRNPISPKAIQLRMKASLVDPPRPCNPDAVTTSSLCARICHGWNRSQAARHHDARRRVAKA